MKKPIIKGILIDPEKQTIEEVDVTNTLHGLYTILDVEMIEGTYAFPEHVGYVDEEGLIKSDEVYIFKFHNDNYDATVAGRCILTGIDEDGENIDHNLDIEDVEKAVSFEGLNTIVLPRRSAYYFG